MLNAVAICCTVKHGETSSHLMHTAADDNEVTLNLEPEP